VVKIKKTFKNVYKNVNPQFVQPLAYNAQCRRCSSWN